MTNLEKITRKIIIVLFAQQSLTSAGFIAASTLNSIVGKDLSHQSGWAGVPTAIYLLGSAFAAFVWGYVFDLMGRRWGLTIGLLLGVLGSAIAFISVAQASFPGFLVGMVLMGIASAAVQLGRFAAAEVSRPEQRGKAISNVVIGGVFGSVIGPFVAEPAGSLLKSIGINELAGAYLIATGLFIIAAGVVFMGLRPDPREIGRQMAEKFPETSPGTMGTRTILQIFRQPAALVALLSMVLGQMIMVLVMVITSLYMRDHNHMLNAISVVISAHTVGMYGFSIISGRLADKLGRGPVIIFGSFVLLLACVAATFSPDVLPLGISLFLLGLGWNFTYVGGSTLLSDQLSPSERGRTQGFNDLLVGLASAMGSLQSGFIFSALGYNTMAWIAAAIALLPLLATSYWMFQKRPSGHKGITQLG